MTFKQNLPYLFLLTLLLFISCQYDPFAHEYTTKKPRISDIIGEYVLEYQTADYKIKEFLEPNSNRIASPRILIGNDGTYEFKSIPNFIGVFDIEFNGLVNSSGQFTIQTIGSIGGESGKLKKHWGMHLGGAAESLQRVGFLNSKSTYKLIFSYGDPDEGKAMVFQKLSTKK